MSYTLNFLLGLQIDIFFIKDIVKTFRQITEIRQIFLIKCYLNKIRINP